MMTLIKPFLAMIVCFFLFSLAACGTQESQTNGSKEADTTQTSNTSSDNNQASDSESQDTSVSNNHQDSNTSDSTSNNDPSSAPTNKTNDQSSKTSNSTNSSDSTMKGTQTNVDSANANRPKTTQLNYENEGMKYKEKATLITSHAQPISFYIFSSDFHIKMGADNMDMIVKNDNDKWTIKLKVIDASKWDSLIRDTQKELSQMGKVYNMAYTKKDDPDLEGTKRFTAVLKNSDHNKVVWFVPQKGKRPALKVESVQPSEAEYGTKIDAMFKTVQSVQK